MASRRWRGAHWCWLLMMMLQTPCTTCYEGTTAARWTLYRNLSLSWNEASMFCKSLGGHLPVFNTKLRSNGFNSTVLQWHKNNLVSQDIWTGLFSNTSGKVPITWEENCSQQPDGLTVWGPDEPDKLETELCVRYSVTSFRFHTRPCDSLEIVVCEFDAGSCRYSTKPGSLLTSVVTVLNVKTKDLGQPSIDYCWQLCMNYPPTVSGEECVAAVFDSVLTKCTGYVGDTLMSNQTALLSLSVLGTATTMFKECFQDEISECYSGYTFVDKNDTPSPAGNPCSPVKTSFVPVVPKSTCVQTSTAASTQTPRSETTTQVTTASTQTPRSETITQATTASTQTPRSETTTQVTTASTQTPRSETITQATTASTQTPRLETTTQVTTASTQTPRSETTTQVTTASSQTPRSETITQATTASTQTPRSETTTQATTASTQTPRSETTTQATTASTQTPRSETTTQTTIVQASIEHQTYTTWSSRENFTLEVNRTSATQALSSPGSQFSDFPTMPSSRTPTTDGTAATSQSSEVIVENTSSFSTKSQTTIVSGFPQCRSLLKRTLSPKGSASLLCACVKANTNISATLPIVHRNSTSKYRRNHNSEWGSPSIPSNAYSAIFIAFTVIASLLFVICDNNKLMTLFDKKKTKTKQNKKKTKTEEQSMKHRGSEVNLCQTGGQKK